MPNLSSPYYRRALLLGVLCLFVLPSCQPAAADSDGVKPPPISVHRGAPPAVPEGAYRIGAGDELAIKFFFSPDMNETMQVRPDGKISLMFVGDVIATGLTTDELAAQIRKKLQRHMRQPELVIMVKNAVSHKVTVGGEVAKAGPVTLHGRETVLDVLNMVGGTTPAGNSSEVALVRADEKGVPSIYVLNLEKFMNGKDALQNPVLQSGDVIMVPPSDITSFDRFVDQYIRMATPVPSSFVITNQYTSGTR